jgi:hypothetical protein
MRRANTFREEIGLKGTFDQVGRRKFASVELDSGLNGLD